MTTLALLRLIRDLVAYQRQRSLPLPHGTRERVRQALAELERLEKQEAKPDGQR